MQRPMLSAFALVALGGLAMAQSPAVPRFVPVPDNAILSSNVKGLAVYGRANEKVGTIEDEVIESGRLAGYILSVGGFLGMGDRHVVVAPGGLLVSYDAGGKTWHARIDVTKDQLKSAPEFRYEGRWGK